MPQGSFRNRLEIEVNGVHIGFVTIYPLEEDDSSGLPGNGPGKQAVGIEICEPAFRNHGYGTAALKAWINFNVKQGNKVYYLETWSGNAKMMKCAEKCGFRLIRRQSGRYTVDGLAVDALLYRLDADEPQKQQ